MERLHIAALVKDDMVFPQGGQYLFFVDADTFLQLAVYFPVDLSNQFDGGLYGLFIVVCSPCCYGFMVGHAYLVELLQVGRIYRNKVDALIQRQGIVFGFQQYTVVERQPADIAFEISVFHNAKVKGEV